MQKINIASTFYQELQTIHQSLVIRVPFLYVAVVCDDEGETTQVISVNTFDEDEMVPLKINDNSPGDERFLAHIIEDARAKAYKIRKEAKEKKDQALYIQQVGRGQRPAQTWNHEE